MCSQHEFYEFQIIIQNNIKELQNNIKELQNNIKELQNKVFQLEKEIEKNKVINEDNNLFHNKYVIKVKIKKLTKNKKKSVYLEIPSSVIDSWTLDNYMSKYTSDYYYVHKVLSYKLVVKTPFLDSISYFG